MKLLLSLVLALYPVLAPAVAPIYAQQAKPFSSLASVAGVKLPESPEQIDREYKASVERLEAAVKAMVAIPAGQRTFNNTVLAFETAKAEWMDVVNPIFALKDVSPDKAMRDKANDVAEAATKLSIDLTTREDIYRALKEYADQRKTLSGVEERLLDAALKDFRLAGFEKRDGTVTTAGERAQAKKIQERLAELETQFQRNLTEYVAGIEVSRQRLKAAGLSEDFIKTLRTTENGNKLVTIKTPDYVGFMQEATDPALKRELYMKYTTKSVDSKTGKNENVTLLKEALVERNKLAGLLGYDNFAQYQQQYNMAKTPETVAKFLGNVSAAIKDKAHALYGEILRFKKEKDPTATGLDQWDVNLLGDVLGYWANRYVKEKLGFDETALQEHFTVDSTVQGTLEIYQTLLDVRFREIPVRGTWHADVKLYEITDQKTGKVTGHFLLDLFPRDGKYGHFAAGDIVKGRVLPDGSYEKPVAFMMGNFPAPVEGKSAHARLDDVTTFFHEFGHIMHQTLTRARYASQSGASVQRDFVEAPSQMLENWAYNFETLKMLSDPKNPLPKDKFDRMMAAKNFVDTLVSVRQVAMAMADQAFHTGAPPADTAKTFNEATAKAGYLPYPEGVNYEAGFGHLMGGYQAQYYGYMWSKVLAQDMFTIFERDGMLNPGAGDAYRKTVLEHGASQEAETLVRWFLGHEPDPKMRAFLKSIGAN